MPRTRTKEKFKTFQDVFDSFTLRNIFKLEKYFDVESLSPISIGKESNVFSAISKVGGKDKLIVKIHRLETSDFNNMYFYIRNDPRFTGLKKRRREIIFAWAQREYRNLMEAREAGVRAPLPLAFLKNIVLMEYIGESAAAPQLKDYTPSNPKAFLEKIMDGIRKYWKAGLVHGDLSKFNILVQRDEPVLIDFSHATPVKSPEAANLLKRDVENVCSYFSKMGVDVDIQKYLAKIKK